MSYSNTINEIPDTLLWKPLESIVGKKRCEEFMFMATVQHQTGTRIYLYKHSVTRQYVNVDERARFYVYNAASGKDGETDGFANHHYQIASPEKTTALLRAIFPNVKCEPCVACNTTMPIGCLSQCTLCGRYHCEACCILEGLCSCERNALGGYA